MPIPLSKSRSDTYQQELFFIIISKLAHSFPATTHQEHITINLKCVDCDIIFEYISDCPLELNLSFLLPT